MSQQDMIESLLYWYKNYKDRDITSISDDEIYTARYDTQRVIKYLNPWFNERYADITQFFNRINHECYERDIRDGIITRERGYMNEDYKAQ